MRQSIKYSPEQLPGQVELLIGRRSKVAPASGQAVVLPAALVVIGQQLGATNIIIRRGEESGSGASGDAGGLVPSGASWCAR